MPTIYLQCETCDILFPSGFGLPLGAKEISYVNCGSKCPSCGRTVLFSAFIKEATENAIAIFSQAKNPLVLARKLLKKLNDVKSNKDLEVLRKEHGDIIPPQGKGRKSKVRYLIALICAIIWWLKQHPGEKIDEEHPDFQHQINNNISFTINQDAGNVRVQQKTDMKVAEPIRRDKPKVGPNAPCPCGSGKKFKRCCGKP